VAVASIPQTPGIVTPYRGTWM